MKYYLVPVKWQMTGSASVGAYSAAEAKKKLLNGEYEDIHFEEWAGDYELDGEPEEQL